MFDDECDVPWPIVLGTMDPALKQWCTVHSHGLCLEAKEPFFCSLLNQQPFQTTFIYTFHAVCKHQRTMQKIVWSEEISDVCTIHQ